MPSLPNLQVNKCSSSARTKITIEHKKKLGYGVNGYNCKRNIVICMYKLCSVDGSEEYWLIKLNVRIYLSKNKAKQLQFLND